MSNSKANRLLNFVILILGFIVVISTVPDMIDNSLTTLTNVVRFLRNYISFYDLSFYFSLLFYTLFGQIPVIFACVFLTYWAVISHKRITLVLGSLSWIVSVLYPLLRYPSQWTFILYYVIILCASIVIFFSALKGKRNKLLIMIPLLGIAIGVGCVFFLYTIPELLSSQINFFGIGDIVSFFSYYFQMMFFIAFGIYVLIDGKPLEKKPVLQRQYLSKKSPQTFSLTDQLNQTKADYEAGKITEEEYKKRRMELLTKVAK